MADYIEDIYYIPRKENLLISKNFFASETGKGISENRSEKLARKAFSQIITKKR